MNALFMTFYVKEIYRKEILCLIKEQVNIS